MARAAGAVDVARMSLVVHANLESEEQVTGLMLPSQDDIHFICAACLEHAVQLPASGRSPCEHQLLGRVVFLSLQSQARSALAWDALHLAGRRRQRPVHGGHRRGGPRRRAAAQPGR